VEIDVVITDIFLPRLSGIKVIKILKKEYPHIKIIAISGAGGGAYNLQTLTEIGADKFLEKPFEMRELMNTVSSLAENAKST
jgi:DNA-binding response OmpR family regulator